MGHKVVIRAIKNIKTGAEITYNYGRDYLINVITRRGCKCDKCLRAIKNIKTGAEITYNYGRDDQCHHTARLQMRQVPEETSGCAREGTRQKPTSPAKLKKMGKKKCG